MSEWSKWKGAIYNGADEPKFIVLADGGTVCGTVYRLEPKTEMPAESNLIYRFDRYIILPPSK